MPGWVRQTRLDIGCVLVEKTPENTFHSRKDPKVDVVGREFSYNVDTGARCIGIDCLILQVGDGHHPCSTVRIANENQRGRQRHVILRYEHWRTLAHGLIDGQRKL